MKESAPKIEQKDFLEVVGDLGLIRKKLTAKPPFSIAFLLSDVDLKIYVSPDNSHEKAAKMANIPSNNAKEVLLKGRISPKISAFIFEERGKNAEDFFKGDIDFKSLDSLVPEVAFALKNWLGKEFENYSIIYKKTKFDRSPESIA